MEARVINPFKHTNTGIRWNVGDVFRGDTDTVLELADMGFVEAPGMDFPGCEAAPDLASMTVRELSAICDERGIEGKGQPRKSELVTLIEAAG